MQGETIKSCGPQVLSPASIRMAQVKDFGQLLELGNVEIILASDCRVFVGFKLNREIRRLHD